MKSNMDWNDIKLFLSIARSGGLSAAARLTRISPATLGRRMLALEKQTAAVLFIREKNGYRLTREGEELLAYARQVERSAQSIEQWRDQRGHAGSVRITAGHWMCQFLTAHIKRLWHMDDPFTLELFANPQNVDIGKRQADIGIRNSRPEEQWLARRRLGMVAFAPYFSRHLESAPEDTHWIGYTRDKLMVPSAIWLDGQHAHKVVMRASSPQCILELLRAGLGQGVLPCFIGDNEAALKRSGPLIPELQHEQWLVLHHEDRHLQKVRTLSERIARLSADFLCLFRGDAEDAAVTSGHP